MSVDVCVIVPVLGRPAHAARFMRSFRENTPENRAVVLPVLATDDPIDDKMWVATKDAWEFEGAKTTLGSGFSFAKKVNCAYEESDEPWLLLVGSDVEFKPRWLESALITAEMTGAKLISTNDLGNRRVMAGEHATHPLVNRAWVDSHGASWDGPGVLACEEYRHCAVDDEWTAVAKQAGVFAYAPLSIIEHQHPYWGKADTDETYKLGEASMESDVALFRRRLAIYGKKDKQ